MASKFMAQFRECKKTGYAIFPGKPIITGKSLEHSGIGYICSGNSEICSAKTCPAIDHPLPNLSTKINILRKK
jgi:hypothetical protein